MVSVVMYQVVEGDTPTLMAHFDRVCLSNITTECDETSIRIFFDDEWSYEIFIGDKKALAALFKHLNSMILDNKIFDILRILGILTCLNSFKLLSIQGNKSSDLTPFVSKN